MKRLLCCALLVGLAPWPAPAAGEPDAEAIKQQVLQELKPLIEAEVQRRVQEELAKREAAAPAAAPGAAAATPAPEPWSPAQPLPLLRAGPAYLDLSLGASANFGWSTARNGEVRTGHHAPLERGFSVRSLELALTGAVDPFFTGLATVALAVDEDGGTEIELEEAYVQTVALPANLQVRAGQFYAEFGRQNPQHAHEWAFVDQPLVLNRLFGGDGQRGPGARVSWLTPLPFYAEIVLGVFNNKGESFGGGGHAHEEEGEEEDHGHEHSAIHGGEPIEPHLRGPQDLLFVPRVAAAFDLTDTQTLLLGASAAFGPNNSGPGADTAICGADLYWKWRPERAERGFPFVAFQAEALYRHYEAAAREHPEDPPVLLPAETLRDWGLYAQTLWGFCPGWVLGLRGEFVSGDHAVFDSPDRQDRFRLSPNLTWYPTEYSKLRWQYNHDHRQQEGDDHSVWMQLEIALGAHPAHKF